MASKLVEPVKAVKQRHTIEQDTARQCAKNEIFKPSLCRAPIAAHKAGEHISGKTIKLEAYIERNQIVSRHHDAHANAGKQYEQRIFRPHRARFLKIARRNDQRYGRCRIDEQLGKISEGIHTNKV